ncbi:hypothetical protein SCLCIDRAFT_1216355 [Scleroderma citrinum Foug A]|uniref:Uncharacterized protein n=1 Tax=Scleroderma citrinum Foug A TaxID=1036808 RepID=A0A0C3DK37_9AGAM|nr:hypothetical protein SCLCIDRAFT_1216355 [Scleroderma citrinum Foug A]
MDALEPGITSVPVQMDSPGMKLTQPRSTTAGHRVQLDQVPALRVPEGRSADPDTHEYQCQRMYR